MNYTFEIVGPMRWGFLNQHLVVSWKSSFQTKYGVKSFGETYHIRSEEDAIKLRPEMERAAETLYKRWTGHFAWYWHYRHEFHLLMEKIKRPFWRNKYA